MRPFQALLPLLSSLILCMVFWTSDVHALSVTVKALNPNTNALLNTRVITFTPSSTTQPGCISGYACNTVSGWSGGSGGSLSSGSADSQIRITTNSGYAAGPTASVLDSGQSIAFALNGFIFQGFSTGAGRLEITLTHNFPNLTDGTRLYGFMENGAFLQPNALTGSNTCSTTPTQCGNVSGDTLTMQAQVDTLAVFPTTPFLRTGGVGTTSNYSFNLSPTASRTTTIAGGTDLKYTWLYNYSNSLGPVTSKFSDPPGGIGNCDSGGPSNNPNCRDADTSVIGGLGVYGIPEGDPDGVLLKLSAATGVPEPSSVLLLGLGLLSGGLFFALRLRKEKERETR